MHSTNQYRVFPTLPTERALSRPRRLLGEGRVQEARDAYRAVLATEPNLPGAWLEYFSLLRQGGQHAEALALADQAAAHFGNHALPIALRGAALVEPDLEVIWPRPRRYQGSIDDAGAHQGPGQQRPTTAGRLWHQGAGNAGVNDGQLKHG